MHCTIQGDIVYTVQYRVIQYILWIQGDIVYTITTGWYSIHYTIQGDAVYTMNTGWYIIHCTIQGDIVYTIQYRVIQYNLYSTGWSSIYYYRVSHVFIYAHYITLLNTEITQPRVGVVSVCKELRLNKTRYEENGQNQTYNIHWTMGKGYVTFLSRLCAWPRSFSGLIVRSIMRNLSGNKLEI